MTEQETAQQQADKGDKVANYLTLLGHICTDINQGAILAILPFLVVYNGYSYTNVALLIFALNIASAIIQPLFGWIGDKRPTPWFMAAGCTLAGIGMFGIGFLDQYWMTVLSAMVCGIGVAMFHPEGGRLANLAAGKRKSTGMSIFAVGGNIGFFGGPIIATAALSAFGMHGTFVFLIPTILCSIILVANNKRFVNLGVRAKAAAAGTLKQEYWGKFALLTSALSLRSIVNYGLMTFIPLVFLTVLGQPETVSSLMLSLYSVCGACATAMSGRISEKIGVYRLLILGFGCATIFIVVLALSNNIVLSIICTMLLPMLTNSLFPASVALSMSYIPNHLGMASGLNYGVTIAIGGIAEPFLGMAGDAIGLQPVLLILAGVQIIVVVIAFIIRHNDRKYPVEN